MEPKVVLVAKMAKDVPLEGPFIGVDRGAYVLASNDHHMVAAVGDFDSVDVAELGVIKEHCADFVLLPREKDETDSESAIAYALERYEHIILCGATNGRCDHFLANIMLLERYQGRLELLDENNHIRYLTPGTYHIPKGVYTYLSFITLDECEITLEGVKYPVDSRPIKRGDIYTVSNEIVDDEAVVMIHKGSVICLECKD